MVFLFVLLSVVVISASAFTGFLISEQEYILAVLPATVSVFFCFVLCICCIDYGVQQTVGSNYCEECKEVYESEYEYCPQDGCKLIPLVSVMEENKK